MIYYKSKRPVGGKPPVWVIIDETGKTINRSPSKDELKGLEKEILPACTRENKVSRVCCNCKSHNTYMHINGWEQWHKHKCQKVVCTKYLCENCYKKYDSNSSNGLRKSVDNRRTGNLDPNSDQAKGDNSQELACILYGWEDLNKKYDNYMFPLDCYDQKTGLYHQVQGHRYSSIERFWSFTGFDREWGKIFETMVCFCISKDGKDIERIYEFPKEEIERVKSISIYKNPSRGVQQYEKYRITDEEELKKANEIWKDIIGKMM